MNAANMGVVRVNITLPKVLLAELEKKVPVGGKVDLWQMRSKKN
jgi:hypothetical protein